MFRKLKHAFHHEPPSFTYPTLPQEPYTTRMIRLLPHEDKSAPIQCELFNYDLSETGLGTHLYQALSYVWGSEMKPESIILNGCIFHVTANLHTALLYLRNRQLERILWVDAICINQDEGDQGHEKSKQIPLMRTIYAQAERVIVWLGDATENGDKALEEIGCLGENGYKALKEISCLGENGYKAPEEIHFPGKNGHKAYEEIWPHAESSDEDIEIYLLRENGHEVYEEIWPHAESSDEEIGPPEVSSDEDIEIYLLRENGHEVYEEIWPHAESSDEDIEIYLLRENGHEVYEEIWPHAESSDEEIWSLAESSDEEIHIPGEAAEYSDNPDPRENYDAYERLLQRDWFSRIWVLQEVGVAQCVYIMCGSVYINGHIFCEGLTRLRLSSDLWSRISPVAYLIHGALYRPKYQLGSRGSISIGELIGMYQYHNATKQHDKVYALLGLSADPTTAALEPNYSLPWKEVFKQTINYIFPECSVEAFIETETAVMKSEGWILGVINSVEENASRVGKQKIQVLFNYTARALNYQYCWNTEWELQAAALIQEGDIICLLKGASNPSIIRLCKDHFAVIILAVTPQQRPFLESPAVRPEEMNSMSGLFDIPLIWKTPLARTETKDEPGAMDRHMDTSPIPQGEERRAAEKRLKHIMLAVVDIALTLLNQAKSETKIIEQILRQSGTEGSIAEELAKVCAGKNGMFTDEIRAETLSQNILQYQGNDVPISEKAIIAAISGHMSYGCIIMELFLLYQGLSLPVSEKVVKRVAGSGEYGPEIMKILFRHRGENLSVSEEVVRAAAGNSGPCGPEILEILFRHLGENLPVSEEVVRAAAGNSGPCGPEIMRILFRHLGENLPVSGEVVKAAAGNNGPYGPEILEILFRHLGENLPVSEEVVKAAAGNDRPHGPRILEVLIQQSKNLPVSEEVVRAAAGNNGPYGHRILEILIQQSKNLPVSEEVVRAAAGNNGRYGPKIIKTLIKQGKNLPVSEDVIRAAAGNSGKFAPEALNILFQHRGGNLPVSEEVVKAAAGNDSPNGYRILEFLFQHRVENLPVSEEVVKAAAGNTGPYRPKVLEILFQFRGENLPVSEEVVKAAAGSSGNMDIKS